MEEQDQLYQYYFYPEHNHKLNFMPVSKETNNLNYPRRGYTELSGNNGYMSIDSSRVLPLPLACLSRHNSRSYIELCDNESTPLLNGNGKFTTKLALHRRRIMLSVFVLFFAAFLFLGSLMFRTLELNEELKQRDIYRDIRQGFLMKYPNILGTTQIFLLIFKSFRKIDFVISLNVFSSSLQMTTWKNSSTALSRSMERAYRCCVMLLAN